jgi:hypothetical protein
MTGKMVAALLGVALVAGGIGGGAGWMLGRASDRPPPFNVIQMLDDQDTFAEVCRKHGALVQVAVTAIEFDGEAEDTRPLTDTALAEIATHHVNSTQPIRKLVVRGAQISDAGLGHIRERFDMLETLDLTNCKGITREGLEHLRRMPTLETIYVGGCDGLTRADIDALIAHFKAGFQRKDLRVNGKESLP